MKEEIFVSVICNTYNHEKYIEDALKSFINQKTQYKYEVFVHDDASTDQTASIIKKYADKYPNLIKPIFEKQNKYSEFKKRGYGSISRDIVFPKCRGKYICFCEGDDYWLTDNVIEKKVDFLEKNPEYVACLTRAKIFDVKINKFQNSTNSSETEYDYGVVDSIYLLSHSTCWMIRKDIYTDSKYLEYSKFNKFGDSHFGFFTTLCGKVRYFPDFMSTWRMNVEGSWTERHKNSSSNLLCEYYLNRISTIKKVMKYCPKKDIKYCRFILYRNEIKYFEEKQNKLGVFFVRMKRKLFSKKYYLRRG